MSSSSVEKAEFSPTTSISKEAQAPPINEGRLLRKLDLHLLPAVTILYLLSFLDRANIGNAKVAGLVNDLDLTGYKYNICVAVFFVTYPIAEIPNNLAMKIFRPSRFIPLTMLAWGLVMTLMSLVKSYEGLIAARFFLGLTEAGVFPAVVYYLSLWYARREQSRRVALFFSAATIAGAFGGILAFGIEKMEGIGGLHGWAWIFLLEGLVTILFALGAFFYIYDYPATARFLEEHEREYIIKRLKDDSKGLATHVHRKFVWQAIRDWKTWMQLALYIGIISPVYAISIFIPSIIQGLGYSSANAQLLTIPPYIAASIFTVVVGILSDRWQSRGPFILGCTATAIAGYSVLYGTSSPGAGYAGVFIAACGVFPSVPVSLAWAGNCAGGDVKRGAVLGIITGIANLGGILSSFVYRTVDAPRYFLGHGVVIGLLCWSFSWAVVAMLVYSSLNVYKEKLCEREGIDESRQEEFADMGDESPLFRYTI